MLTILVPIVFFGSVFLLQRVQGLPEIVKWIPGLLAIATYVYLVARHTKFY
jgi:hypothetical protein